MSGFSVLRHLNLRGTTYTLVANPDCVADIEDGTVSSKSYNVGDYILRNDVLYEVIKAIPAGGTFITSSASANRNIQATDVGKELTGLRTTFSSALTALKNTAIARAVGATGDTFTSVIAKLATIVNRGTVNTSIVPGQTYTIDAGYYDTGSVSVAAQTGTYKPTTRNSKIDMGATNANRYVDTTAVPNTNSGTYTPTSRGNLDMGATNTYRYVNTNNVPNTNSGTYTPTSRGTLDMGATNTYRYVNTGNVPNSNSGTFTPTTRANHDMGATNSTRYVDTTKVNNKPVNWLTLSGINDYSRYTTRICDGNGNVQASTDFGVYTITFTGAGNTLITVYAKVAGTYYYNHDYGTATVSVNAGGIITQYKMSEHSAAQRYCFVLKLDI